MTYPRHLASDVVLRDGSTVSVRPVRPADAPLLLDFFRSLDERSLAFRFFTGAPRLEEVARVLAEVDQRRRFGLLAFRGAEPRPVGHGFFAAVDAETVEVAFAVSPALQGRGLGSVLLAQLAERAAEDGFGRMVADVLPENHAMVSMFRDSGFPLEVRSEPGAVVVEMATSPTPEAIARFQERDAVAARAAVAAFFDPATVAAIDGPVEATLDWARRSVDGVRAVVVRGDPDEWGRPGSKAERRLLAICRRGGARLIGPASGGLLDNRPGRTLNLTAGAERPPRGGVGIVTQDAAAGRALLEGAVRRGLGVSTFVSLGSRADVTANDLLEYWEEDPATPVALLQVESFIDPRRLARVARRVGREMPIVVIAERAAEEAPGRGLFDQVGVIRARGAEQAIDAAMKLADRAGGDARRRHPPAAAPAVTVSAAAAAILATALAAGTEELDQATAAHLLDCYGIATARGRRRPTTAPSLHVSGESDPLFGPVLRCGPAGMPAVERPARLCPLAAGDAAALLDLGPPADAAPLPPAARRSLERVLEGAATAMAAHAEIASLEIRRLAVTPSGAVARAVRIRVRRPPERRPWPRTWE
ncbi:MAG TPA: GNAT family N-acetyltransferase [Solirubrobacterales bacterium]|nr:GNAT family N-acetyltransferase [Solirubrobacterales bacterium]